MRSRHVHDCSKCAIVSLKSEGFQSKDIAGSCWTVEHDYAKVDELRGSVSYATSDEPAAFERARHPRTLDLWAAQV